MNTEQRLRFEAKHEVPEGVKWFDEVGYLLDVDVDLPDYFKARLANRQNDLWKGYQSALEDRQGEAVATLRLTWQRHAGGGHYEFKLMLDSMEFDTTLDGYNALCEKFGGGEHKLFTSPQPDKWKHLYEWLNKELNCSGELMSMAEYTHHRTNIEFVMKQMESMDSTLIKKGI